MQSERLTSPSAVVETSTHFSRSIQLTRVHATEWYSAHNTNYHVMKIRSSSFTTYLRGMPVSTVALRELLWGMHARPGLPDVNPKDLMGGTKGCQ